MILATTCDEQPVRSAGSKPSLRCSRRCGPAAVGLTLLVLTATGAPAQQIHLHPAGSFAPDGSPENPFQLVRAGICKATPGGTLVLHPGDYREVMTVPDPNSINQAGVTLTALPGSSAVIGNVEGLARTTLKVLTYNTHLFGPGVAPTFDDGRRAELIGEIVAQTFAEEGLDVVGLTEVWDEDLADVIMQRVGSPEASSFYGDAIDSGSLENSGLLLLSRHPLTNRRQVFYHDESGFLEPLASKGFLEATMTVTRTDGFTGTLGIFLTHTQADQTHDDVDTRALQLRQLSLAIGGYQIRNPTHEIIAMGDFNVDGESSEYQDSLRPSLDVRGLSDAVRHTPCFDATAHATYAARNDLVRIFEGDEPSQRLDYVFYSSGAAFDFLPRRAAIREYTTTPPLCRDIVALTCALTPLDARVHLDGLLLHLSDDLSDHYGLMVEFDAYR